MNIKRIFLITIDALRADHVGIIQPNDLTPNIDEIGKKSYSFSNAYSNGPGTNQSLPALLTSVRFLKHDGFYLSEKYPTLAEILGQHGYYTIGFNSNPFLSSKFGYGRGFNEYHDFIEEIKSPSSFVSKVRSHSLRSYVIQLISYLISKLGGMSLRKLILELYYRMTGMKVPYIDAKKMNEHVINSLENIKEEKLFVWIHYMDTHYPYIPPKPFLTNFNTRKEAYYYNIRAGHIKLNQDQIKTYKELYKGEIKYVDHCIGELFEYLDQNKMFTDSLIIITADHGDAFNEHKQYGHRPNILYNEVIKIPLIIHGIGYKKIDTTTQLLDIAPTVLDILNIPQLEHFQGKSIKTDKVNKIIISESAKPDLINLKYDKKQYAISCILDNWKYIINKMTGEEELFNLSNDPHEKNNILEEKPILTNEFKKIIHQIYPELVEKKN